MVPGDPECDEVIPGTGGFRKVRVGRRGMGKRGGARVIYILRNAPYPIFLIAAYAKNDKGNLPKQVRSFAASPRALRMTTLVIRPIEIAAW
jgi:hypothetical protein